LRELRNQTAAPPAVKTPRGSWRSMREEARIKLIQQVMGASHIFCTTVNELLERALSESSGEQLVLSQVKLLLLVGRPGQRFKVTDVADFLGVTNAAASRAIDRLVQRGLIDRTVSKEDRRAVDLRLTPESEALLEKFEEVRNRELLKVLGDFPADDLRAAVSLLDALSVRLAGLEPGDRKSCLRCGVHFRQCCVMRDVLNRECVVAREMYGPADGEEDEAERVAEAS
jgi:DNA-binding MarR family transcriptional regulator